MITMSLRIMKKVWGFLETVPFHETAPRQDLVSRGTCLAKPGRSYLVYLDTGGAVDVKLGGGTYEVQWINAQDTSDRRPAPQTRTGKGLRSPAGGDDWLLRIVRTAND